VTVGRASASISLLFSNTLKPRYNDPFNNKIPAIKNLVLNPSIVNYILNKKCNNKTPVIKNKIFGPFRFVKARFLCSRL
jgi:hypothetical protein